MKIIKLIVVILMLLCGVFEVVSAEAIYSSTFTTPKEIDVGKMTPVVMGKLEQPDDDILVGVNYFAGWWKELPNKWHGQGWNVNQPDWRPKFPERVPSLGHYNDQATMDREI